MLSCINKLHGYTVHATDGAIGKVHEFLFHDASWRVRYMVADTGNWLTGRRVLLPVGALGPPSRESRCIVVSLTRQQVADSPDINTDQPITRQHESELQRHFGWANYFAADPLLGDTTFDGVFMASAAGMALEERPHGDPHLESTKDVAGYHIQTPEGEIGRVADFVVDDREWILRYIEVERSNLLRDKKVLLAVQWVEKIDWANSQICVGVSREQIKDAPPFKPAGSICRNYESRIYEYYGRPKYWP
jgi:hypothetical protein